MAPDPFLKENIRTFEWYTSVFLAFIKEFRGEDDSHLLKGLGEKVKKHVKDNVEYEGITKNFRVLKLETMYTLQRLDGMEEKQKALQLKKLLKSEIARQ